MAATVHRPLKIIAFNLNGIWWQCYELRKQLQELHIDVALFSETHLKAHRVVYSEKGRLFNNTL
jgi:exonuclease III